MPLPTFLGRVGELAKGLFGKSSSQPGNSQKMYDLTSYIMNDYRNALDYFSVDRDREKFNWEMYSGLDNGQWDKKAAAKLAKEGRQIAQYNFIRNKVDGTAGFLIKNRMDIDFAPIDGKVSNLTTILKNLYYADKELLDWDASFNQFVLDFCIFGGTEEMVISDRYSPFGNIGFERILPGHIIFDPNWDTNSGWDLKKAFKISYLTPEELKNKYHTKVDEIENAIMLEKYSGPQYQSLTSDDGSTPRFNQDDRYGSRYRVVECHDMRREYKNVEYAVDGSGRLVQVPDGDDSYKQQWAIQNAIDLEIGIIEKRVPIDVYYVTSVCDQLMPNRPLQEARGLIQIGRLPFFHSSFARINGRDSGLPDLLKDAQQAINKRQSLIDYMMTSSANGGMIADPMLFGNDASKMADFEANRNDPKFLEWSAPGEIASGREHIKQIPKHPFPAEVVNDENRLWDISDRISKMPAASDGRSEGSEESGILYARKQQQAEINNTTILKAIEQHENEKGEAYMLLAQTLYSGVYREFRVPGLEEKTITINDEVMTENGPEVMNDISKLPRHRVIVTQSTQGVSYRERERAINAELIKFLPPQNPISRSLVVKNIMESLDSNTEDRAAYVDAADIELQLAIESTVSQIKNLKFQQAQIDAQMQQLMNPMPQPQVDENGQPIQAQDTQEMQPQETNTPIQ
jgi:hypothetical protein